MPVNKGDRCPYAAEWEGLDEETGKPVLWVLYPEDVLGDLSEGFTTVELCRKYNAPLEAIEHTVSMIPFMLAWRDTLSGSRVAPPQEELEVGVYESGEELEERHAAGQQE